MATLGTQSAQRERLRRAVGHGADTALVDDDLIDDCLGEALRQTNRHFPSLALSSFLTVADQQAYTPLPAGGRRIVEVYYPTGCDDVPAVVADALASIDVTQVGSELGDLRVVEPAHVLGDLRAKGYLDRFFTGQASLREATVYLIPTPGTSGSRVYFVYEATRYAAIADVDEVHERPYWAWAKKCLHEALAAGRGAITEVETDKGIRVRNEAAKLHGERAKAAERDFLDSLPIPTPRRNIHRKVSPL